MASETTTIPLMRAQLHRPPVAADIVCREAHHDKLNAGRHLPFTLVSSPTGNGKTTLISHWLETRDIRGAWLSLDKGDNDLRLFLMYLTAAFQIQSLPAVITGAIIIVRINYTLNRKLIRSPSFTSYVLPSSRTVPFFLAAAWVPASIKSS